MNKTDVTKFIKVVGDTISKHSPGILTGIGVMGIVTTTVLAVKATPKALELIEKKKKEEEKEVLTPVETVKATWKCYIPAAVSGTVSIACVIGANSVNARRNAALATAYKISETAFSEYKEKVVETIGEKKEKEVREKISKDKVDNAYTGDVTVMNTGKGDTLFLDSVTKRFFKSDIDVVKKVVNELNRRMISEMYISLNDLYIELGLPTSSIGDEIGWNISSGYIEPHFEPHMTDDDKLCFYMSYHIEPRWDFSKLM